MSSSAFLHENYSPLQDFSAVANGALQSGRRDPDSGGEYALWETGSRVTLSLAPDDTSISNQTSSLYATFGHLLNAEQLEETILRAFQTWAQHSSINVGLVADSGDDFGILGQTQGDLRFGDVRVGAVPMAGDVFAIAVNHNDLMTGTWAGDVLFNSNADFSDVDQVFAVALHEAGHVLGLEHSTDETSAMHPTVLNQSLNSNDILSIKSMYGDRVLDQYDLGNDRNDTMETAIEIRNTGSIDGIIPLAAFGDIENASDVDYFYIRPNSGYQGSITFRLISKSVSSMRGRLTVFDQSGNVIETVSDTSNTGSDISYQLSNVDDDQEYFVKIESLGNSETQFGSYGLITTIDGNYERGEELIEPALRRNYGFLSQGDVQELFLTDLNGAFDDDMHTNDTPATATELEQSPNAASQFDYRIQASITDNVDIDYYSLEAFDSTMLIRVNAMEMGGLISKLKVYDEFLNPISGEIKVNGNGEQLIEYAGIVPGSNYFVSVAADRPGRGFDVGNYDLSVAFNQAIGAFSNLGDGRLSHQHPTEVHTLYVARSQLFHFALTGISRSRVANATIWMTVYDENGEAKYRVATRPDETRTSQSVILRPGSYSIRVHFSLPTDVDFSRSIMPVPLVDYRIDGLGVSDPTGPEIIDPADDPFSPCDITNNNFCYPNNRHSAEPFIVVDGDELNLPPPTDPRWRDANSWYWDTDWLE